MPLKPKNTMMVPTKGWSVELPDLGPKIVSINYGEFIAMIKRRLESNGKDTPGWKDDALDLMCRQRPDIECEDDGTVVSREVTSDDVKRFVSTLIEAKRQGAKPVPVEEQERRASICAVCPNKGHVSCFGGCGTLATMLSELVVGANSNPHPDLHKMSCLSCGCELSSLILYPIEVLHAVDEKINFLARPYDSKCWKLPQNANHDA